jgi:hypothetical protein
MLIKYSWFFSHIRYILIEKNEVKISIKTYYIIFERWQNWIIIFYSVIKYKFINFFLKKRIHKNKKANHVNL